MGARILVGCAILGSAVLAGCALLTPAPPPNELVDGAHCTIRVWDPANPEDASKRMDYWGTVASSGPDKIVLVDAASEAVAGKPLLEDPKLLPPAIWVRRLRQHGKERHTIRRDQILSVEVLDPSRLKQVMTSYPLRTRCNIRTCNTDNPHDPAGYRDLWGALDRPSPAGLTLIEASDEPAVIGPAPGSIRVLTDEARVAHQKTVGSRKFTIAPERIIAIEWLEGPPEKPHAQSSGFTGNLPF